MGVYTGPEGRLAPQVGFEPTTRRLTAGCSTTELLRSVDGNRVLRLERRGSHMIITQWGTREAIAAWLHGTEGETPVNPDPVATLPLSYCGALMGIACYASKGVEAI